MQVNSAEIVRLLLDGKSAVFPTETVFALAADARNSKAISHIYQFKHREINKPLAIIGSSQSMIESYVQVNENVRRVMKKYMPGALTCVLPIKNESDLSPQLITPNKTLGVRIPDHALAIDIIEQVGAPLAATSVNRSGEPSATKNHQVVDFCGDKIAYCLASDVVDEPRGLASTVVDFTQDEPELLREGEVLFAEILAVFNQN